MNESGNTTTLPTTPPPAEAVDTPRGAGNLEPTTDYRAQITVRKGRRVDLPRRGESHEFSFQVSEGLPVLKAKFNSFLNSPTFSNPHLLDNGDIFFKNCNTCPQARYVRLTEQNFEEQLKFRWGHISPRMINDWAAVNLTPVEGLVFEFFMYIDKPVRTSTGQPLLRASQARIQRRRHQLEEFMQQTGERLGPIATSHVAIVNARSPADEIVIPNDNTTQQARRIDEARLQLQQEEAAENRTEQSETRNIQIRVQGQWLDVEVKLSSLRDALGLPRHNIFNAGIYQGYVHPAPEGDDVEDTDHHP